MSDGAFHIAAVKCRISCFLQETPKEDDDDSGGGLLMPIVGGVTESRDSPRHVTTGSRSGSSSPCDDYDESDEDLDVIGDCGQTDDNRLSVSTL